MVEESVFGAVEGVERVLVRKKDFAALVSALALMTVDFERTQEKGMVVVDGVETRLVVSETVEKSAVWRSLMLVDCAEEFAGLEKRMTTVSM